MKNWTDYLVIVSYFVVLILIGVFFSRKKETAEGYLLGGRSMPVWAIAIACIMSLLSSISIIMVPGEIYGHGITLFLLPQVLALLSIPCYLLFVRFYFKLGSFTPYEFLEYRYDGTVRAVVAGSSFYLRVMYLATVLYATSKIFETAYHWPNWLTIVLVGVIGLVYTWMGGSKAVVWTDVFQFFVLFGSFAAIVGILCWKIDGGLFTAIVTAWQDGHGAPQFTEREFYSFSPYVRLLFWMMLWNAIVTPLTSACSDQITIQRLLSTKNWKEGLKSQVLSYFIGLPFVLTLWFVGFALYTFYKQTPQELPVGMTSDSVFFHFVTMHLPSPLPGLFMAGLLAAVMSTISSGMNSMATVWLKEFHVRFINKKLAPEGEVRVSKQATVWIGAFVCMMSFLICVAGDGLSQSIAEVGTIFYLLGAAILPAFLLAVLSKRANSALIWGYTAFAIGEGIAMNCWYGLSRYSEQLWQKDHSLPFGWAGKMDWSYFYYLLAAGILFALVLCFAKARHSLWGKVSGLLGFALLGAAQGMLLWCAYSNALIDTVPMSRSFTFTPPFSLFEVLLVVFLFPVQPEKKWRGLTLSTIDDKILAADAGERK